MNDTAIRIVFILPGLASTILIVLNLLTDRSTFWAIWPIWAFAMLTGAVIGAVRVRPNALLGIWLGGGFFLIVGLVAIDIADRENWWSFWPAGVWILLSALFVAFSVDLLDSIPTNPTRRDDTPRP